MCFFFLNMLYIILVITNLMQNNFIFKYLYYIPLHVSSNVMLIIRRLNCINTASGIVSLVGGLPVHRLRENSRNLCTGRPPMRVTIPDAILIQFNLLMMSMTLLETGCERTLATCAPEGRLRE